MSLPITGDIDIVCLSLSRWDAPISSPAVSLCREFSKKHRVFFIEHPYSCKDIFFTRKLPGKVPYQDGNVTIVTPPVVWPVNFLPDGFIYDRFASINNSIVLKTLRMILQEMDIRRFIFINFFDPFYLRKLPADIRPLRFIYQCMDDISQVPYTAKHGIRLEEEIIRNADITLCTSRELTRLRSALSSRVYFHPNAADISLFRTAFDTDLKTPSEILFPGKKVIGFTGSIEYRTDYELLKKLAAAHTDKIICLVGPVYGNEYIAAGLDRLSNIVFTGPRKIGDLPAYLQRFDCCIIPYKKNTLTRSIYPLKINEYLAAGKPVVATDFSDDICSFNEVAYIVPDHQSFIEAVDAALNENDASLPGRRIVIADQNSWEKRVEAFWQIVAG